MTLVSASLPHISSTYMSELPTLVFTLSPRALFVLTFCNRTLLCVLSLRFLPLICILYCPRGDRVDLYHVHQPINQLLVIAFEEEGST